MIQSPFTPCQNGKDEFDDSFMQSIAVGDAGVGGASISEIELTNRNFNDASVLTNFTPKLNQTQDIKSKLIKIRRNPIK